MTDTPSEEQPDTPSVSTAPPEATARKRGVPSHLGPARTSTVLLVVAFLAIGLLYLFVRPEPTGSTPAGPASTDQPAGPATTSPNTTPEPSPTSTPVPTTTAPTTPDDGTTPTDDGTTPTDDGTTPTTPSGTPEPTAPDGTGGEPTGVPDNTPAAPPS